MSRLTRAEVLAQRKDARGTPSKRASKSKYNVSRPVNNGKWTTAMFVGKVVSHLRILTRGWSPSALVMATASVSRHAAVCECCLVEKPKSFIKEYRGRNTRKPNFEADHERTAVPLCELTSVTFEQYKDAIEAGIDPITLFKSGICWNTRIARMFAEDGWSCLCKDCHSQKTAVENLIRKESKMLLKEGVMSVNDIWVYIRDKETTEIEALTKSIREDATDEKG